MYTYRPNYLQVIRAVRPKYHAPLWRNVIEAFSAYQPLCHGNPREALVKFESDVIILTPNLINSKFPEIWR